MASCGGAGDDCGRSPPVVVYDDLVEVREHAATLQTMLQGSPSVSAMDARELLNGMVAKLSSAMSVLGTTTGGLDSSSGAGRGAGGGRRKRPGTVASGPHRRSSSRRRSKSPFINMVTARTLNDGKSWRKYGQKRIQACNTPRSYYMCSHKPDQGCQATKQVQESDSNPSEYLISYYGQHTCKDPSTFRSLIIQGAADAAPHVDCTNLISFACINGAAASTSTNVFPQHLIKERVDHPTLFSNFVSYSSSPTQDGGSKGAPSGSPSPSSYEKFMQYGGGQLVLVDVPGRRASPLTVGSAQAEFWPVVGVMDAGTGMDSFPSSPSSLGFMSGSFGGSFGNNICDDDDLFGFDS